jgi:hypothetical protein
LMEFLFFQCLQRWSDNEDLMMTQLLFTSQTYSFV